MTDESMSYKDALEYMTTTLQPTYNDEGAEYKVSFCKLHVNGEVDHQPLSQPCFEKLRLYKTKPQPKPVFIPFWDAIKAAGQDGKCIRKYEHKGTGIQSTYRFKSDYPTEWQYWNGSTGQWYQTIHLFNHVVDADTYWAIVEDPSNRN